MEHYKNIKEIFVNYLNNIENKNEVKKQPNGKLQLLQPVVVIESIPMLNNKKREDPSDNNISTTNNTKKQKIDIY